MKKKSKFYAVWVGRMPGVYSSWEECKEQIHGYENAVYKSFPTIEQALKAFTEDSNKYIGSKEFESSLSKFELELVGQPVSDGICVDGAWNTRTNEIEYQGVSLIDKKRIFHAGPFNAGTNNIAEFLAIVHALTYCKTHSLGSVIYSDSKTAISWIKKKKAATKIEKIPATEYILSVVRRAEEWLEKNPYSNEILKWETGAWGENPADFGRK
jgi:ribonuclease HI